MRTLMGIALALAFLSFGRVDAELAERKVTKYCEMVAEYRATSGASGWPDFHPGTCADPLWTASGARYADRPR